MHRPRLLAVLLLFVSSLAGAQVVETPPSTAGGRLLHTLVEESRMEELRWPGFNDYRKHLRNFYAPMGYTFAWSRDGRVTPQARTVIALFEAADAKGINAVDYDGGRWAARMAGLNNETALARFDMAMSITLMRYISDLHIGRINPVNIQFDLDIEAKKYYLPKLLSDIKDSVDPVSILTQVEPQYDDYRRLQQQLALYRRIAADAETEKPLPVVKKLGPGATYDALPQLARMLRRFGDLPANAVVEGTTYSGAIVDAVKRFQSRHGLDADGILAARSFAALNVPASQRVKQIQWALERWRWAPMDFSAPPIIVNLPEFRLRGWDENNKTSITMRVVVGRAYKNETPVFSGDMKYIVFRPYWNVPPSIQRGEIAPKASKDPSWLARNNYEIVSNGGDALGATAENLRRLKNVEVRVRQKPGPSNALGLVKFMFPNQNNVYLHHTPSTELFSRSRRDFSHGCIRVEDPVALAAWVLRERPEWTTEKIKSTMKGDGIDMHVILKKPIPVMIIYATAVATEDGQIHFYEDIYGHDETLENALAAGYPYPA
ncbi:MAG TPA: L,D-transpeptidase family protein [Thermoanaerobaculia bacterium]